MDISSPTSKCCECSATFRFRNDFREHVSAKHTSIEFNRLEFNSFTGNNNQFFYTMYNFHNKKIYFRPNLPLIRFCWAEFSTWLKEEENKMKIHFVRSRAARTLSNGNTRCFYYCQYDNDKNRRIKDDEKRQRYVEIKIIQLK